MTMDLWIVKISLEKQIVVISWKYPQKLLDEAIYFYKLITYISKLTV